MVISPYSAELVERLGAEFNLPRNELGVPVVVVNFDRPFNSFFALKGISVWSEKERLSLRSIDLISGVADVTKLRVPHTPRYDRITSTFDPRFLYVWHATHVWPKENHVLIWDGNLSLEKNIANVVTFRTFEAPPPPNPFAFSKIREEIEQSVLALKEKLDDVDRQRKA